MNLRLDTPATALSALRGLTPHTQAEIARRSGLSRVAVSELELGKAEPSLRTAMRYVAGLGENCRLRLLVAAPGGEVMEITGLKDQSAVAAERATSLRALRLARGEAARQSGYGKSWIGKVESGERAPFLSTLAGYLCGLGYTPLFTADMGALGRFVLDIPVAARPPLPPSPPRDRVVKISGEKPAAGESIEDRLQALAPEERAAAVRVLGPVIRDKERIKQLEKARRQKLRAFPAPAMFVHELRNLCGVIRREQFGIAGHRTGIFLDMEKKNPNPLVSSLGLYLSTLGEAAVPLLVARGPGHVEFELSGIAGFAGAEKKDPGGEDAATAFAALHDALSPLDATRKEELLEEAAVFVKDRQRIAALEDSLNEITLRADGAPAQRRVASLRTLRLRTGRSARQVSATTGVTRVNLAAMENGDSVPRIKTLELYLNDLGYELIPAVCLPGRGEVAVKGLTRWREDTHRFPLLGPPNPGATARDIVEQGLAALSLPDREEICARIAERAAEKFSHKQAREKAAMLDRLAGEDAFSLRGLAAASGLTEKAIAEKTGYFIQQVSRMMQGGHSPKISGLGILVGGMGARLEVIARAPAGQPDARLTGLACHFNLRSAATSPPPARRAMDADDAPVSLAGILAGDKKDVEAVFNRHARESATANPRPRPEEDLPVLALGDLRKQAPDTMGRQALERASGISARTLWLMEQPQADMHVKTLRRYIEAHGYTLELRAAFPGGVSVKLKDINMGTRAPARGRGM